MTLTGSVMSICRGTLQSRKEGDKSTRQKRMLFCVYFGSHPFCSGVPPWGFVGCQVGLNHDTLSQHTCADQFAKSNCGDWVLPWTTMTQNSSIERPLTDCYAAGAITYQDHLVQSQKKAGK